MLWQLELVVREMPDRVADRSEAAGSKVHGSLAERLPSLLVLDFWETESRLPQFRRLVGEGLADQLDLVQVATTDLLLKERVDCLRRGQDSFVAVAR